MNDIYPIKAPIELALFSDNMIKYALFFLLFIVLLILLFGFLYFNKKRKQRKNKVEELKVVNTKVDHYQIAKDKLIDIRKYLEQGEFKIFHLEISKLLRVYLSGVFEIDLREKTSTEILQSKKIDKKITKYLKQFFSISDYEKFATKKQKKEKAEEVYKLAELIVEKK